MGKNGKEWEWMGKNGKEWEWMGKNGKEWEWMGKNGKEWEWMGMNGNEWEWMGKNGNEWEWMGMNGNEWNEWELLITMELTYDVTIFYMVISPSLARTPMLQRAPRSRGSHSPALHNSKGRLVWHSLVFYAPSRGSHVPKSGDFMCFYVLFGLRFRDFGIVGLTVCWERMHGNVVNLTLVQSTNVKNWWIEPYNSGVDWARDDVFNLDFNWF